MQATIRNFLKMETAGGIVLMAAAVLALIVANSPLREYYQLFLDVPVEIRIGTLHIAKPLILWVNDGLMAIFFFLIGLELKREVIEGELSKPSNILLPALGAVGGMVVPVAIYIWFNSGDPAGMRGWAIPAATDIAFALAILMLMGNRVPISLKVFLVSLAIFDDLGAVAIIALFFADGLSVTALIVAAGCLAALSLLTWKRVVAISPYIFVGVIMWTAVLKSGVHATLAGVALSAFIPMRDGGDPSHSPLREIEHDLHYVVAFGVLPLFAFVNAGVSFGGVSFSDILHPIPLGIAVGLFVGKQLGVFTFCAIAIKLGLAKLPEEAGWGGLYGVSILTGVGFTMSLFIGGLAFENIELDPDIIFDERLGIILGSVLSGVVGFLVLHKSLPRNS